MDPRAYPVINFGRILYPPSLIKNCNCGKSSERGINTEEKLLGKYKNGEI